MCSSDLPSAPEPVALATPAPADPPAEATVTPTVPVLPTSWTLDPARSSLYVQVFKDPTTTAAGLSHDHVIAATGWSGSVTWPADLSGCAVSVSVPTSGLRADADAMRARVGYESRLSEDQRKEITGHFLAADQLDAARFPTLTFEATGCESAKDRVRVTGALTIHGVAKTIMVPLKVSVTDTTFAAAGTFTARATDFGFSPFTALLGALKNKDEMTFTLDVKGSPR